MTSELNDCWNWIGVLGDRSCRELPRHIHCRNCPVFGTGAMELFRRAHPDGYIDEFTEILSEKREIKSHGNRVASVFRIGAEWLALPAKAFVEVVSIGPIRRIPHKSGSVLLGMVNVHGYINLCFSLASLLGLTHDDGTQKKGAAGKGRFCVMSTRGGVWVFQVDEVWGLVSYSESEVEPAPVTVAKSVPRFSSGVLVNKDRQIGLLDDELLSLALEGVLT